MGLIRIINIYWAIECISKPRFEGLLDLARIIDIYWQVECTSKTSFE